MSSIRTVPARVHLEKPRPLKSLQTTGLGNSNSGLPSPNRTLTDLITDLDSLLNWLNSNSTGNAAEINRICGEVKQHGFQLESKYSDVLDRVFDGLRTACVKDRIDRNLQVKLVELIELRAAKWNANESTRNFYRDSQNEPETNENNNSSPNNANFSNAFNSPLATGMTTASSVQAHSLLSPNEAIKPSGKYPGPIRISGKSTFKDEIIIRNSDSGKVMGIKGKRVHTIEEMSETVISFQRVPPGTKDRLVQITGPDENCIERAKELVEETIRRNASPVRNIPENLEIPAAHFPLAISQSESHLAKANKSQEIASNGSPNPSRRKPPAAMGSNASATNYSYTVPIGSELIRLTGTNFAILKEAKIALEEYFRDVEVSQGDDFDDIDEAEVPDIPKMVSNTQNSSSINPFKPPPKSILVQVGNKRSESASSSVSGSGDYPRIQSRRSSASSTTTVSDDGTKEQSDFRAAPPVKTRNLVSNQVNGKGDSKEIELLPVLQIPKMPKMPVICYSREFLMELAMSAQSMSPPADIDRIRSIAPQIVKSGEDSVNWRVLIAKPSHMIYPSTIKESDDET